MTATTTLRAPLAAPSADLPQSVEQAAELLARQVPFRSPQAPEGSEQSQLIGELPAWLRGQLVRVAPSFGATPHWAAAHWFDALGLVFDFALRGTPQLELRWRVLDCALAAAAASGKVPLAHFSTRNQRSNLRRLFEPVPELTDNANVNIVRMGDELVAMTETPHQLRIDPSSLRVLGRVRYDDRLAGRSTLAHPIIAGDSVTSLTTKLAPKSEITLYRHRAGSRTRRVLGSWSTRDYPYIHSFGLSERTGIIIDQPLHLRVLDLLWSNRGVIEHFKWRPERGTRLVLIDLSDGRVHLHETESLLCFHTVHAFETSDATVLDLLAYDDASLIGELSLPRLAAGLPASNPRLIRLSVDRKSGKVTRRQLSGQGFEFPQVDWERAASGEQQFVHGTELVRQHGELRSRVVRVELAGDRVRSFAEADYVFGEPVFVGKPERRTEGEGVLLTVGSNERGSALFVLDAPTLEPLAHAEFTTPLPLGFHGSFIRA